MEEAPLASTAFAAAVVTLALGCAPSVSRDADPLPRTADELAGAYLGLALSLGERDPLFLDLVFTDAAPPDPPPSLREIGERADRLARSAREMARTEDEFRVRRIEASVRALGSRARYLLGERRSVAVELGELFGLEWTEPVPDLERLHFRVDRALPGVGPLPVRVRRYYERSPASPASAGPLLREALAACRTLALPASAGLEIEPLGLGWISPGDARERPTGSTPFYRYRGAGRGILELPQGIALRSAELNRLACHEGVPGHHLQATVADAQFRATGWPELGIVPLYDPRTAVLEGLSATFERLRPGAPADEALRDLEPVVTSTLARYLDGEMIRVEAVRALDFEALVPYPHPLLDHADRFGSYALVRPSADPVFQAALETLLDPALTRERRFERILRAIREAMSPAELQQVLAR